MTASRSQSSPRSRPSSGEQTSLSSSRSMSPSAQPVSLPVSEATVQVVVRLRPMNEREKEHGTLPVVTASSQGRTVTVVRGSGHRQARSSYSFDNVFSAFATQKEVFDSTLRPILNDVMQGFESTIFAYGQTGTGKTHTMEGDISSDNLHGVIPRSAQSIFETLSQPQYESYTVTCSYLEIYNEELCDLLADGDQRRHNKVEVMEGKDGIFCRGQIQKDVNSAKDVLSLMRKAQQFRKIGETTLNKQSSRSHCIFTLKIHAKRFLLDGNMLEIYGKLNLVDLAGSESATNSRSSTKRGLKETREIRERSNINRSLLTLGRVILMLKEQSQNKKTSNVRIPYRDSKLTRLLQKSLGGKCKTLVIATLSPSITSIEESVSTLNYAQSANGIVNKPVATSYISINSSAVPRSIQSGDGEAQTLEHWYQMECRLQYMQTQVEEAQAALARNYMVQKEVVDRAENAERSLAELQEKFDEANQEIEDLKKEVLSEKEQKEAITLVLKQTEMHLKRTTAILEATQKTEVSLTAEGAALLETLAKSISNGDQLYNNLVEVREADVQRRLATRKFHSMTIAVLEKIMSTLNSLSKTEEEYCSTAIESAEKGNKDGHESLNLSVELVKEVTNRVSELTSLIKSLVQDDNGIVPLLSKLTEDVQQGVGQSKGVLIDGEEQLSTSFQATHQELEEYSNNLKSMDSAYARITERLLACMDEHFSQSKDEIKNMISSVSDALSNVRNANSQTRNALDTIISDLEKESTDAATHIEEVSKNQSGKMTDAIESFLTGMQNVGDMRTKLNEQVDFIGTEGNTHMESIGTQGSMLSAQRDFIAKAKEEQQTMKDQFLTAVFDGVKELVDGQMDILAKKQEEHLTSFNDGNKNLLENNDAIGLSADSIIKEVKTANHTLLDHVEQVDKNDLEMKANAEDAKAAFIDVENTAKRQQESIETHVNNANGHMTELSKQDEEVGDVCESMQAEKDVVIEHVTKMVKDEKNAVAQLTDASNKRVDYTSNTVIANVTSNLVDMEKPRKDLINNISGSLDQVVVTVNKGKIELEAVANKQCDTANELFTYVESKQDEFETTLAQHYRGEFDKFRASTIYNAEQHLKVSSANLSSSGMHVSSTKTNIADFATDTMQFEEDVPPVPTRKEFEYSMNLSATPPVKVILKKLDLFVQ